MQPNIVYILYIHLIMLQKLSLFNDDSSDEEDEHNDDLEEQLRIKPQFEGPAGQKVGILCTKLLQNLA